VAAPLHMVAGGALILLFCDVFWLWTMKPGLV
jgi:hypothetical protein